MLCGRRLRTGIKYCYVCKSPGKRIALVGGRRKRALILLSIMVFTIFALVINGYLKEGGNVFWVYFWVLLIIIVFLRFHIKKKKK